MFLNHIIVSLIPVIEKKKKKKKKRNSTYESIISEHNLRVQ